jgi:rSAM/selenodomain-associated transferase 1
VTDDDVNPPTVVSSVVVTRMTANENLCSTTTQPMNVLGIFVKHPVAGRVKTRLAADVGADLAAGLYAAFVGDIVERFRTTAATKRLCFAPNTAESQQYFREIAGTAFELWPQPEASLGERLAQFFANAFAAGAKRSVVIGSDSPTLPSELIDDAFERLVDYDCVVGPATDGGYYLLGQSEQSRNLFADVDWSQPSVLRQTVERIQVAGARLSLLPPWYDIDTVDDLELLRGHISAMRAAGHTATATRTESYLAGLGN